MDETPIDLPDEYGNVVSLVVRRESLSKKRFSGRCQHTKLIVDEDFTTLECRSCGKHLNPVEWLAKVAEFYRGLQRERSRYESAKNRYEAKSRCKCEHCGKITRIKPASNSEVAKFEKK
jgi:ribosomal protein S27E